MHLIKLVVSMKQGVVSTLVYWVDLVEHLLLGRRGS